MIDVWQNKSQSQPRTYVVWSGPPVIKSSLFAAAEEKIQSVGRLGNARKNKKNRFTPHITLLTLQGHYKDLVWELIKKKQIVAPKNTLFFNEIQLGGGKPPYPSFAIKQQN